MKLEAPENPNYAATVVEITRIVPLENCDNIVGTPLLGYQAIVSKDTWAGDIGVVFTAETQVSEEFARLNNLHRHGNLNDDESAKGFLEDNRRVRALKLRGHRSDALFMPLASLVYTGADISSLRPGDTFDKLNGHDICKKYVVRRTEGKPGSRAEKGKKRKPAFKRVDERLFLEHMDTGNFFRARDAVGPMTRVVVTQKLHGTSVRFGRIPVRRELSRVERIARAFGVRVQEYEQGFVVGSRRVVKSVNGE